MAVEWSDQLSIGVEELDDQHRSLFKAFGDLVGACQQGRQAEQVLPLMEFLEEYTRFHFNEEERLMRESGYPGTLEHCRQHRIFISRLECLKETFDETGPSQGFAAELTRFLLKWIVSHIKESDHALALHLRRSNPPYGH